MLMLMLMGLGENGTCRAGMAEGDQRRVRLGHHEMVCKPHESMVEETSKVQDCHDFKPSSKILTQGQARISPSVDLEGSGSY